MLAGRLGLETARVPHADRQGLLWLGRGNLIVNAGTLHFLAAGTQDFKSGDYQIPFQGVSMILLGPGTTISHDALRLLARHGTGLIAVGEDGVRMYTAPPLGPGESALARRHAQVWASGARERIRMARRMYAWRLGEILPVKADISILRGMEGARMKETYKILAQRFGVAWQGRFYDRQNPLVADAPNQAINHAATAVEAAATIAVAATGTIPSLGFIHEDASTAFCLDIADLYRDAITLPAAFQGVRDFQRQPNITLERHVRRQCGHFFRREGVIPSMIDRIKELFAEEESSHSMQKDKEPGQDAEQA
ncbi:MAG: type I-E CRISPR-associated endonuclease Cas1 [Magnetococcales bacterium]|nr:type I-E CRISPR-associated endonuclease Cas1 [Magnetococcales bacterium]MBF0323101.1 type I-E CRISPR-associated endonuclease Cas1 [Magnetococcales bacterium]